MNGDLLRFGSAGCSITAEMQSGGEFAQRKSRLAWRFPISVEL